MSTRTYTHTHTQVSLVVDKFDANELTFILTETKRVNSHTHIDDIFYVLQINKTN